METGQVTLSTLHIRSEDGKNPVIPAGVRFRDTGNLAKVDRERVAKTCCSCGSMFLVETWKADRVTRCKGCRPVRVTCPGCGEKVKVIRVAVGEEVKSSGEVVKVREPHPKTCPFCDHPLNTGTRDIIRGFSMDSRRRLMRLLATLASKYLPCFVTLTFPDAFPYWREPAQWYRILRLFEHRFRRSFPSGVFFWRLETVDRKSGNHKGQVFPHYHLLVFGVEYNQLRDFVEKNWHDIAGFGDEHHLAVLKRPESVTRVNSRRGVFAYASKTVAEVMPRELAKDVQTMHQDAGGEGGYRWWGVVGDVTRFQADIIEVELTDKESTLVLRTFRKLAKAGSRAYASLTVFLSGTWLLKYVTRLFSSHGENSYRTGRRYDVPFWQWARDVGYQLPAQLAGT